MDIATAMSLYGLHNYDVRCAITVPALSVSCIISPMDAGDP